MAERDDQIWAPYNYLEQVPGKGMRSIHIEAFNTVLQAPPQVVDEVKLVVQQLHTASLLLDDIEDNAELRRGQPVAHRIFGTPRTINSASFVMLATLQDACQQFPNLTSALFEELLALHKGQSLDLYWRDCNICPTEQEYETMVSWKTGGLYRLAVKLLQGSSSSPHDLVPLADCLGLIYQIQDDYLNLKSDLYQNNKGFAEDITEGKYSFPVVHCVRQGTESQAAGLVEILKLRTTDTEAKQRALDIISDAGSFDYTLRMIRKHYESAHDLIVQAELPDSRPLVSLLNKLVSPTLPN